MFYKLKKIIKKYGQARPEFLKETKTLFLENLENNGIVTKKQSNRINLKQAISYSLASVGLIAFFSGGTMAFAEIKNVPAQHPLYQAKRISEKIQVTVSPKTVKPELHNKFAQRRLEEIKRIKEPSSSIEVASSTPPTSTQKAIIDSLNKDFHKEIKSALKDIETPKTPETESTSTESKTPEVKSEKQRKQEEKREEQKQETCASISRKIKEHGQISGEEGDDWQNFKEKCPEQKEQEVKFEQRKGRQEDD